MNAAAWIWATAPEPEMRDGKRAIPAAQRACELLQWKRAAYIDTLAAAYAETGGLGKQSNFKNKPSRKQTLRMAIAKA